MTIGIIGAGDIGAAFARHVAKAGLDLVLSNQRGPDSLAALVADLGPRARAGSVAEAAKADVVFLGLPWKTLPQALAKLPRWEGRIVIDPTNPISDGKLAELDGRTSSEIVSDLLPCARLVKAFNTLSPAALATDPRQAGGRRVIFLSGDHAAAKTEVSRLIDRLGFAPVDLGSLANGGRLQQFPGGPLPALNLIKLP